MKSPRLRKTRQRRVILEEIRAVRTHPTADEVYALVRPLMPRISLATVYRNLERLAEEGIIRRICPSGAQRRYDADTTDHHHVRCLRCGRVDDVTGELPCCLEDAFRSAAGYEIVGHNLEILGVCPACRTNTPVPPGPDLPEGRSAG